MAAETDNNIQGVLRTNSQLKEVIDKFESKVIGL